MNEKNNGIEYELLTQNVFKEIMHADFCGLKTLNVKHNVKLRGLTTEHQIDVYWEFAIGGIQYSAIVQAKDWVNKVSKGEILKLKGIKDDLPDINKAVFVTRTGYQKGAVECAQKNGICLYVLDKENCSRVMSSIELNIHAIFPLRILLCEPSWDIQWIKKQYPQMTQIGFSFFPKDINVYFEDGSFRGTFENLLNDISSKFGGKFNEVIECSNVLDNCVFLQLPDGNKYKANDFHLKFVKPMVEQKTIIKNDTLPGFILVDILSGEKTTFNSNLQIISK